MPTKRNSNELRGGNLSYGMQYPLFPILPLIWMSSSDGAKSLIPQQRIASEQVVKEDVVGLTRLVVRAT